MAAITPSTVVTTGLLAAPAAVSASDTIAGDLVPASGGLLYRVINGGGSPDSVVVTDGGTTPAGTAPGTAAAVSVVNGTTRTILITRNNVNLTTNLVTITHSFTTTVTYELQRV